MSNPYEEAGKSIERGMAHYRGDLPEESSLPKPVVFRPKPTATWTMRDPTAMVDLPREVQIRVSFDAREGRVIRLSSGDKEIRLHGSMLIEFSDALRAALLWDGS